MGRHAMVQASTTPSPAISPTKLEGQTDKRTSATNSSLSDRLDAQGGSGEALTMWDCDLPWCFPEKEPEASAAGARWVGRALAAIVKNYKGVFWWLRLLGIAVSGVSEECRTADKQQDKRWRGRK